MTASAWEQAVRGLLADPGRRQLVMDCYFDQPALAAAERYAASSEWTTLRGWIGSATGGSALDIGAGNGISTFALARDGWNVTALEPDPSDLVGCGAIRRLCAEAGLAPTVVQGHAEELPFDDSSFDLVFARQVLHHARDLPAFCREVARVMRPGGRLVAVRDHVISGPHQLKAFLDSHPLHRYYGGENAYTMAQYTSALHTAGLVIAASFRSFDSAVNYAPHTTSTLASALEQQASRLPLGGVLVRLAFATRAGTAATMRLLSAVDNRPGRLASFYCVKPGGGPGR